MASQIRLSIARKILDTCRFDPENLPNVARISSLLELDKNRPEPEFYISSRDLNELIPDAKSSDVLKLSGSGEIEKVQLRIKPPKNEKLVFKVNRTRFTEEIFSGIQKPLVPQSLSIVVDFSSPNIAKPFHVGHLRSTIIGGFVSNIASFLGHKVTKLNYLGDWGTQFGYLNVGVDLKSFTDEDIRLNPITRLYEAYVAANRAAESDPAIHEKAKAIFSDLESGKFGNLVRWDLYKWFTVEELTGLYERLGVAFDEYHWESMYGRQKLEHVVTEMDQLGLLEEKPDGAKVASVGDRKVPVIKSDGTTLYLTRDIAAYIDRHEKFGFDEALYVVDSGQSDHFRALFSILEQMNLPFSGRGSHIKFGRIKGMSTRKGTVVFLKDILDEARDIMRERQKNSENTKINLEESSSTDVLGISAVIVNDLKQRRMKDYDFSWDNALQANGDTGVKLQYTHCRLCSLEQNSGATAASSVNPEAFREHDAQILIVELGKFPEAVARAYESHEACVIVNYLFSLSNATSRALKVLKIKQESDEELRSQRLLLFNRTRETLNCGMRILGLKPLTQM